MSATNNQRPIKTLLLGLIFVLAFITLAGGIYAVLDAIDQANDEENVIVTVEEDQPTTVTEQTEQLLAGAAGINVIDPPRELSAFTLPASTGSNISLDDLAGQYVLVSFGYTHCPDVCPANLLDFRQIKRGLGDVGDNVTFLFISVDPDRDTPEFLNRYLQRYDPTFIGLSGEQEELTRIADDYGLFWEFKENPTSDNYLVDHTASRFLINPEGELIRVYSFTTTPDAIQEDIRQLVS